MSNDQKKGIAQDSIGDAEPHTSLRVGGWLPHDPRAIRAYLANLNASIAAEPKPLLPEVEALKRLIEGNLEVLLLVQNMIAQVPAKYEKNPANGPQIRDYHQMLALINAAIQQPPPFNDTELVGFPINAIFDWTMGTNAGSVLFLREDFNRALQKILKRWCRYLSSGESLSAFKGRNSWMSKAAREKIDISQFKHESRAPAWGFKSWNDFFIREFRDGLRPVADPDDPRVIVSACESTPFAIQHDVNSNGQFWVKSQPYSLSHLLAGQYVDEFAGGTVYQAFLSAFNYHRWHSPVAGKIVDKSVQAGTYYAEAQSEGFDPGGPNRSQGYIAHLAARAIIFIEADDPIGLMAVVPVGMSEVSSNIITVRKRQRVKKGGQLGYFQFGGSTHCLVFRKGVIDSFAVGAIPGPNAQVVKLGARVATAAAT